MMDTESSPEIRRANPEIRRASMAVGSPHVRRRGLHREVVDVLGQRIVRGDYTPGSALPNEADLGHNLDVSRTVVREAIKVLASKGLVDPRPRTGTHVLERVDWNLIDPDVLGWQMEMADDLGLFRDLSEVRSLVEPRAARLAASRRTEADATKLGELMDELTEAADDAERYIPIDLALHAAILHATHNELLAQMTGTIRFALTASRRVSVRVPGGPESATQLHRDVIAAIQNSDPDTAERKMGDLVAGTARDIDVVFDRSGRDRDDM